MKIKGFKPSLITKTFFPNHNPKEINYGECFIWAYLAFLIFKEVELWYMDVHAFVKYKGKFYDSQRLRGVSDWRDLPATEGMGHCPAIKSPIQIFKYDWRNNPEDFNTSWEEIESKARSFLRKYNQ